MESDGSMDKEVVFEASREQGKKLKVAYTNTDILTSVRWKVEDYLKESQI